MEKTTTPERERVPASMLAQFMWAFNKGGRLASYRRIPFFAVLLSLATTVLAQQMPSPEFTQALRLVAMHGDLTDSAFVANTLGITLKSIERNDLGRAYYVLEQVGTPFLLNYNIGPKLPENGNKQSVIFSIIIDPDRYCLKIGDVYDVFGRNPLPGITPFFHYLTPEAASSDFRDKKHGEFDFHYDFPGGINFLRASFEFAYQDCARRVAISQNQRLLFPPPRKNKANLAD